MKSLILFKLFSCYNDSSGEILTCENGMDNYGDPKTIKTIIIGGGIDEIPPGRFSEWPKVEKMDSLTSSLKKISHEAFSGCPLLSIVNIPLSLTEIGERAFERCSSLTDIPLTNVKVFGNFTFSNSGLITISLPSTASSISMGMFYACQNLSIIYIPDSITSIGNSAFYYCTSLSTINFPSKLSTIEKAAFFGCSSLKTVSLSKSLSKLYDYCFDQCTSLTTVTIYGSIDSLPKYSFYNCTNLNEVTLPSSLTMIQEYSFAYCLKIEFLELPKKVNIIKNNAFARCENLRKIEIPSGVFEIANETFIECKNLGNVKMGENVQKIGSYAFFQCISLSIINFPSQLSEIDSFAFTKTNMKEIFLDDALMAIGEQAFAQNSELENLSLPDHYINFDDSTFSLESNLKTVFIYTDRSQCETLENITKFFGESVEVICNSCSPSSEPETSPTSEVISTKTTKNKKDTFITIAVSIGVSMILIIIIIVVIVVVQKKKGTNSLLLSSNSYISDSSYVNTPLKKEVQVIC